MFYQQCNGSDLKKLETDWTPHDNSYITLKGAKFTLIVARSKDQEILK